MQLFSVNAAISFKRIINVFVQENIKKNCRQKLLIFGPVFFQYCQPAQNQLKSQFLLYIKIDHRATYIKRLWPSRLKYFRLGSFDGPLIREMDGLTLLDFVKKQGSTSVHSKSGFGTRPKPK